MTQPNIDFVESEITKNPVTYERNLMAALVHSHRLYLALSGSLCPWDSVRGVRRPDFSVSHYNVLYEAIASFWGMFGSQAITKVPIPQSQLEAILIDWNNTGRVGGSIIEKILEEVRDDLYKMEITDEFIDHALVGKPFQHWLSLRLSKRVIDEFSDTAKRRVMTLDDCKGIVNYYGRMTPSVNDIPKSGGSYMRSKIVVAPKLSTSLPGLDATLAGGFAMGDTTLVAGVTGGGKTVLAMQFALDFVKQCRHVVYVTTEQPPSDLIARGASNYASIPFDKFTQRKDVQNQLKKGETPIAKEVSVIPDDMWTDHNTGPSLLEMEKLTTEHLLFIDWSRGCGKSIEQDFAAEADRVVSTGFKPEIWIFDWIGGGLDKSDKNIDLRLIYQNAIDYLIEYGKRTRQAVIAFAQFDLTKAMNRPQPGMAMVSECKTMAKNCANFIGISAIYDKTNKKVFDIRQNLFVEKSRYSIGGIVPVQRQFWYQRFRGTSMAAPGSTSIVGGSQNDIPSNE